MPERRLPVVPDLDQLKHQAKDLLRALRARDPEAVAELEERHPAAMDPSRAKLADAQLVLARSYQASSWTRLVQAVHLVDAIWRDDRERVQSLVLSNRHLLHEPALIRSDSNWGPPLSYAANLGRDEIIRLLHSLGATDLLHALERASLQGQVKTAQMLYEMLGKPTMPEGALGGPAYTLNVGGTRFILSLGAPVRDAAGECIAPVDVVLQTDSRRPADKHAILALYEEYGLEYPDTAPMALHRGRIDLLEGQLARDPALLQRTFRHTEIYPPTMGCKDPIDATVGTPLDGTTLLHMAIEFDEHDIVRWLLDHGADPNARAAVGASGFGGFTPLFNTVVSQPNFWMNFRKRGPFVAPMTELLLERGADVSVRASLWKRLHPGHGDTTRHDYRDVSAVSWGRRFHDQIFVSEPALRLIEAAGGVD